MSARPDGHRSTTLLRRVIVWVIVVAFGTAAIAGIAVLVGAWHDDESAWRVVGTTSVIGAFSAAVLCCVSLIDRPLQLFGLVSAAVAVLACALTIAFVWGAFDWSSSVLMRLLWTGQATTVALSFASLLLLLADHRRRTVRIGLVVTLAMFAFLLGLILVPVWNEEFPQGELYPRTVGVVAILASLGAVVLPVLSLVLRERPDPHGAHTANALPGAPAPAPHGTDAAARTGISAATDARLREAADARGVTPDALLRSLLDDADASAPGSDAETPPRA